MAELENEVTDENVADTDTTNENVDTEDSQEDETTHDWEITYEQALDWKKQAVSGQKATKNWVLPAKEFLKKHWAKSFAELDAKIWGSKTDISSKNTSKEDVKKILAEERFYDKNPDAESYRDKIEKYQEKGLSLEESYLLASKNDKEVDKTREVYWKSILKWKASWDDVSAISVEQFDSLPIEKQEEYSKKMTSRYWKVKFK